MKHYKREELMAKDDGDLCVAAYSLTKSWATNLADIAAASLAESSGCGNSLHE